MNKQKSRRIPVPETGRIWTLLLMLWIMLIYGHSLTPANLSGKESGWVMDEVLKILHFFGSEGTWMTEFLIRKCAHFFEYFVFGILLMQNFHYIWQSSAWNAGRNRRWGEKLFPVGLAVLAVPFCDETIQLFVSGRAGQIADVWLDMSGAVCGILFRKVVGFLLVSLANRRNPRRRRRW